MNALIGENGIIANATWSSFSTEMTAIIEAVNMEASSKYLDKLNGQIDIFTSAVPVDELSKTLKQEIQYISNGMRDNDKPSNYNEENIYFMADENGNLRRFHYVSAKVSRQTEEKVYIYDEERNVVYKVKGTNILGTTLHTYEYACKLKGMQYKKVNVNDDAIITKQAGLIQKNGIAYYEPDLENFKSGTVNIVYYQTKQDKKIKNDSNSREISYYLSGLSSEVKISNDNYYIWYDYSNKAWANIKCISATEIESYWVWIPRYAYKITGEEGNGSVDIKFVTLENKYFDGSSYKDLEEGYIVAEAFSQDQELKGIWMSKYEPSKYDLGFKVSTKANAVNAPDLSGFDKSKTWYVEYDTSGNEVLTPITKEMPEEWYDYTNKKWANIKCENTTDGKKLTSYWVWVPRYAYRMEQGTSQIIYIDENNVALDSKYGELFTIGTDENCDFRVHPAFEQGGEHLKGIWVSKYEPSYQTIGYKPSAENSAVNAPDLTGFDQETTYYITYGNDGTGTETATKLKGNSVPSNWYDYTKKIWANIKTTSNGIEAYWVWIPSYAYKVSQGQAEIIYVKYDTSQNKWVACDSKYSGEEYTIGTDENCRYRVHEAFLKNGQNLSGIWVSKYEPSSVSNVFQTSTKSDAANAPDLSGFNLKKTYYVTYGSDGKGTETATVIEKADGTKNTVSNWYDYTNKKWANIKCENTTNGKTITSYWVWIPSYAYRVVQGKVEIIYIKYDTTSSKWIPCDSKYNSYTIGTNDTCDFRVQPAFEKNSQHLDGIWVSKYEPSKIDIQIP